MSRLNVAETDPIYTHGGAKASKINKELMLRRSVMACMLWEDTFYEDGKEISKRIAELIPDVKPEKVAALAIEARSKGKLRHVPLWVVRNMARIKSHKHLVADTLAEIIQRADELAEFMAIYTKDKEQPLSSQVKKGLARAFVKFSAYDLGKYNRDGKYKLRDVLFLTHPKPKDAEQAEVWKKLVDGTLESPDTWEVALSASQGKDKKENWERLLRENKMGALALIRNLRNFEEQGVDRELVIASLDKMNVDRVLPYRFITAAKHAPRYEEALERAMFRCMESHEELPGKTILIVDVSGSMYNSPISGYSEMDRAHAACSLAILVREFSEKSAIYATAGSDSRRIHKTELVPSRRGFALSDAIYGMCNPLGAGGIFLRQVCDYVKQHEQDADRIIVITDEQDCSGYDDAPSKADAFGKHNYIINVSANRNGIGYGRWNHVDGFSEAVIDWILEYEKIEKPTQ
jgi:hypothetical protein